MTGKTPESFTGVRAKLAEAKSRAEAQASEETLPISGVKVTIPGYINHGQWMVAQRQGKGDIPIAQLAFVAQVVLFEGEKLTLADIRSLVDAKDVMFLVAKLFGDKDEEDADGEAGKGEPLPN